MGVLVIEKGKNKGSKYALPASGKIIAGRDSGCDLVIDDMMASRRHFQIECRNGRYFIRDLNSSNGTYVNGKGIKFHALEFSDRIQVGDTLLSLLDEKQEITQMREFQEGLIAGYRLKERIGRGGMGTVYLSQQLSLYREVALKILSNEFSSRKKFINLFVEEARASGHLNHPNIIQVFDVGQVGQTYFFSMEYMSRGSVDEILHEEGKLPLDQAIDIVLQAARGLEYAEKKRIIHRDIKPANLMINEENVVKIGDLGIAWRLPDHENMAETQGISGSPHYIAPEHASGNPIDHRVDIYSLGITFYQLLTGHKPYTGKSPKEIILKHVNEDPYPLEKANPSLPSSIVSIVKKMMARDPDQRFSRATEVIDTLEEVQGRQSLEILSVSSPSEIISSKGDEAEEDKEPQRETEEAKEGDAPPLPSSLPRPESFFKRYSQALISLLILILICFFLYFLNNQLEKFQNRRFEKQYSRARSHFDQGNLEKARLTCREILSSHPRNPWQKKTKNLLDKINSHLETREKKLQSRKLKKVGREFQKLVKRSQVVKSEGEFELLLNQIDSFLKKYGSTSLGDKARKLRNEVQTQRARIAARRKEKARFIRRASQAYREVAQKAKSLAQNNEYGRAIKILNSYPSAYSRTIYENKIKNLQTALRREGRQEFRRYFKNTSIYQLLERMDSLDRKKEYGKLTVKVEIAQKTFRQEESNIRRKARDFGLPAVEKDANYYLLQMKKKISEINKKVKDYLVRREKDLFEETLKRAAQSIRKFYLTDAISKIKVSQRLIRSSVYQKDLNYYLHGCQALLEVKKKLIDYINKKGSKSKIYRFVEKYGTSIIWGTAIRADRDRIVYLSESGKRRKSIPWRKISTENIILYYNMMDKVEDLSARNYFGMAVYCYYAKKRMKALRFFDRAVQLNKKNRGRRNYRPKLDEKVAFFSGKL